MGFEQKLVTSVNQYFLQLLPIGPIHYNIV